jgi:hypothetical protein
LVSVSAPLVGLVWARLPDVHVCFVCLFVSVFVLFCL